MTLPDERYRSLVQTKRFLEDLLSPKITPGVPKQIRMWARSCLRHWPDDYHLSLMCEEMPDYFQGAKDLDPLYKMVKIYNQEKKSES